MVMRTNFLRVFRIERNTQKRERTLALGHLWKQGDQEVFSLYIIHDHYLAD